MKLLEDEGMLDCKIASTPLNAGLTKLTSYDDGLPDTRADLAARSRFMTVYGKIRWLADKCRVDLLVTANFYGRFMSFAKEKHLNWIRGQPLRYLNGTRDYGLVYQGGKDLELNGASDADFAGDHVSSRSTIGGAGKMGEFGLIWGQCTLLKAPQTSTGQAETSAVAAWCKHQTAMRILMRELQLPRQLRAVCKVDNAGVVKQAVGSAANAQAKHYRVDQAYIREECDCGEVHLDQCPSSDNYSDFFTKALDKKDFERHRHTLMGPQANPGKNKPSTGDLGGPGKIKPSTGDLGKPGKIKPSTADQGKPPRSYAAAAGGWMRPNGRGKAS